MAEVTYTSNLVDYKIETKNSDVAQAKQKWLDAKSAFESYRNDITNLVSTPMGSDELNEEYVTIKKIASELKNRRNNIKLTYSYFLTILQEALEKEGT